MSTINQLPASNADHQSTGAGRAPESEINKVSTSNGQEKRLFVNSRTFIPLTFRLCVAKKDEDTTKANMSDANAPPCLQSRLVQSINFAMINKFTLELAGNQERKNILRKVLPGPRVQLLV